MSADLEREELAEVAREVACEKVGQCFTQGTDVMLIARAVKAAKYAYLAAATLRARRGLVLGHVTPHQPPPLAIRRDESGMVVVVRRPIGQPRPPAVGL